MTTQNETSDDGFDDLDLGALEQGAEAIEKEEKQYTQYAGSGGRVEARKGYEKAAALGESETEGKILKAIVIAIAIAIPCLTIYWQMSGGSDEEVREEQVE